MQSSCCNPDRSRNRASAVRNPSVATLYLRARVPIAALLLVAAGCNRSPGQTPAAPPVAVHSPSGTSSVRPVGSPRSAAEPAVTTRGQIAGVRYLEQMTGGARPDERVPMIVALHPMGGNPVDFLPTFRRYRPRGRLILPYGHPNGGGYIWYDSVRYDVAATTVTREADRLAAALVALAAARPTVGKPIVTGFSQGGIMTFALAVTHPDALSAAFPISGLLPSSLYPSAALVSRPRPATLPPIVAFHGAADLAVPTRDARASIAELRNDGYAADLHEYAGIEHDISDAEQSEILGQIAQAADRLADAVP